MYNIMQKLMFTQTRSRLFQDSDRLHMIKILVIKLSFVSKRFENMLCIHRNHNLVFKNLERNNQVRLQ